MNVTITEENGQKFINIKTPVQPPTTSKSGKTKLVASSGGFIKTEALVDGKVMSLNLTATIPHS